MTVRFADTFYFLPPQDDPRYVWHATDGLRARAATGLGCVQAGAQKLGVIEASYASAIIGADAGNLRRNSDSPLFLLVDQDIEHIE